MKLILLLASLFLSFSVFSQTKEENFFQKCGIGPGNLKCRPAASGTIPNIVTTPEKSDSKPEALGCERTDAQTITCADGVYVKSAAINGENIIEEVYEKYGLPKAKKGSASDQ